MSGRAPLSRTLRRSALAALLLALLPACSSSGKPQVRPEPTGPVPVPVPTINDLSVVQSCSALLRALPQEIGDGLERREVTGDPLRTAAWGEPAVTLECGVPRPSRSEPPIHLGSDAESLVSFTTRDVGAATRFTTSDRAVRVAVTIPDVYDSQVLMTLTGALRALPTPTPSVSATPTATPSG